MSLTEELVHVFNILCTFTTKETFRHIMKLKNVCVEKKHTFCLLI